MVHLPKLVCSALTLMCLLRLQEAKEEQKGQEV